VGDTFWEAAAAIFALAALYMLVKPSGNGPAMVTAVTGSIADIVTFATAVA
jgi:hypothetical protein